MGGQWFSCLTFGPLIPNNDWWYQPFIQHKSYRGTHGKLCLWRPCKMVVELGIPPALAVGSVNQLTFTGIRHSASIPYLKKQRVGKCLDYG